MSRGGDLLRLWRGPFSTSRRERFLRMLPALGWMAVIFTLSSLTSDEVPSGVIDERLGHALEYFVLTILLMIAVAGFARPEVSALHFAISGAIAMAWAASDEWHQSFTPGRDPSVKDLAFDAVGTVAALLLLAVALGRGRR